MSTYNSEPVCKVCGAVATLPVYGPDMCQACSDAAWARIEARAKLEEMPLSFEKVITNHRRETIEYEILLGTGGPADRVYVITDFSGAIESAKYQFQDWFQPWTTAEGQDSELVERFAAIVGFYEEG